MTDDHYIIRGGSDGRERLRVLSRALRPSTSTLLDRLDIHAGARCLDAGCGGGDVTLELARRAGTEGSVVGVDVDAQTLEIARQEAQAAGVHNVDYRNIGVGDLDASDAQFDVAHARFLLSHLPEPEAALRTLAGCTKAGGRVAIVDVDFAGCFCHPPCEAYATYCDLYIRAAQARGADPEIGRRLPQLAMEAGLSDIDVGVVQPANFSDDVKRLSPLTFEFIADSVVAQDLITREEIDPLVDELYAFAADPSTIISFPRIVQVWGTVTAR